MTRIENDVIINEDFEPEGIIFSFDIYYSGWECDSKGWVVEQNGKRFIVLTSHGEFCKAERRHLFNFIGQYKKAINNMEKALEMLNEN